MKNPLRSQHPWLIIASALALLFVLSADVYFHFNTKIVGQQIKLAKGAPFLEADTTWAEALLKKMTLEQKVGQLIMIELSGRIDWKDEEAWDNILNDFGPGAISLKPGALKPQLELMERLREKTAVPLLIGAPAAAGIFFPKDSISARPQCPTLFATADTAFVVEVAESTALQMKRAGIHINFAPDLGFMSKEWEATGDSTLRVYADGVVLRCNVYLERQQAKGILVCASTYPNYQFKQAIKNAAPANGQFGLDSLLLKPFKEMAALGLSCMQVAHKPEDQDEVVTSSISDSLHHSMTFAGLVISDLRDVHYKSGEAGLAAIQNGSDMVRICVGFGEVHEYIVDAVKSGKVSEAEIDAKVKKVLLAKTWVGLPKDKLAFNDSVYGAFPWKSAEVLGRKMIASSLVLLGNRSGLLPFAETRSVRTACILVSDKRQPLFVAGVNHYAGIAHFDITPTMTQEELQKRIDQLKPFQRIIIAVFESDAFRENADKVNDFITQAGQGKQMAVVHMGSMESLGLLRRFPNMIQCFGQDPVSQNIVAQALYGGSPLVGRLPWTCSGQFCFNDGLLIPQATRLKYGIPEESGIPSKYLLKIDSVITQAIKNGVFPGCQVFVACKGNVVLNRSWGYHKYDREQEVKNGDLYDLASVTKVAATTLAIMKLYDEGKIKLDTTLNYYFKDLDKNSKGKKVRNSRLNYIYLRQIMTHYSGLPAGLPIARFMSPRWYLKYMKELEKKRLLEGVGDSLTDVYDQQWTIDTNELAVAEDSIFQWLFSKEKDKEHSVKLGEEFFMRKEVIDSLWDLAKQTAIRADRKYVYSDFNFYLVRMVADAVSKTNLDEYVAEKYYKPMNLGHLCFNPLKYFDEDQIAPTEDERGFRDQLIRGYVHDPTAALQGGVSGNAGLFSNAEDLGILLQMLLDGGSYGGKQYLSEKTIQVFTEPQEEGFRSLGWVHNTPKGIAMMAEGCSPSTYGHTGFTGTSIWVDPQNEIVFVFLSNRNYPTSNNKKIITWRTREKVQQLIYDALKAGIE
jgi:CubicO group peptidase (beta-lactamase class C family)/beta-glucosidase-like glycosyl hydrolase